MLLQVISWYLFLGTGISYGCLQLNGQDVAFPSTSPTDIAVRNGFDSEDHGVVSNLQFTCSGQVDAWEAYFEVRGRYRNIWFQVWRPMQTSTGCTNYSLVGTNNFVDQNIRRNLRGQFVPPLGDVIQFQAGDVVGFYTEFTSNRALGPMTSIQTTPGFSVDSSTYFNRGLSAAAVSDLTALDSCTLTQESLAPLLTAMVTEAIPTTVQPETSSPTISPTSSPTTLPITSPPTTGNEVSTTLPTTIETSTQLPTTVETSTQLVQTSISVTGTTPAEATQSITTSTAETVAELSTSSSSTGLTNTMDSITVSLMATGDGLVGSITDSTSSQPPSTTTAESGEMIPLTTLILAVVIVFLVSTTVIITTIILFRCVWSRLRRRKRRHLDLTIPKGASNKVLDKHVYGDVEVSYSGSPAVALSKENSQMYEVPLCKTATSVRTNHSSITVKSSAYNYSPHSKQELENTYEVPIGSVKVQADRIYTNTSFGSRKLSSTASPLPPLPPLPAVVSEYSFINPRNMPANANVQSGLDEDYCDVDGLDSGDQNGLSESNIYEALPF